MHNRKKVIVIASVIAALAAGAALAGHHKSGEKHGPRAERMLERLDQNRDGKITLEEMKAVAIKRFSDRDIDGDGTVTRKDRQAKRTVRRSSVFEQMDADGNGTISKEEFVMFKPDQDARSKRRGRHGLRGPRMGRFAPLTIQEVEARVERRFSRLDSDAKGYVTLDDLKSRRGQRRKWRGRH